MMLLPWSQPSPFKKEAEGSPTDSVDYVINAKMRSFALRRRYRPRGLGKTEGRGAIWVMLRPGEVVRVPDGCPGMRSSEGGGEGGGYASPHARGRFFGAFG
jgi:hypothetical protein